MYETICWRSSNPAIQCIGWEAVARLVRAGQMKKLLLLLGWLLVLALAFVPLALLGTGAHVGDEYLWCPLPKLEDLRLLPQGRTGPLRFLLLPPL